MHLGTWCWRQYTAEKLGSLYLTSTVNFEIYFKSLLWLPGSLELSIWPTSSSDVRSYGIDSGKNSFLFLNFSIFSKFQKNIPILLSHIYFAQWHYMYVCKLTCWMSPEYTANWKCFKVVCFAWNLWTEDGLNKTLGVRPGYYVSSLNSRNLASVITPHRCLSQSSEAPRGRHKWPVNWHPHK